MSGAPVFARETGLITIEGQRPLTEEGILTDDMAFGQAFRFVGIYTQRPLFDPAGTQVQLGKVFNERLIAEIIGLRRPGDYPF